MMNVVQIAPAPSRWNRPRTGADPEFQNAPAVPVKSLAPNTMQMPMPAEPATKPDGERKP
jgi:hypothetical protein